MKVLHDEPLKKHTSFRVGGPAKVFAIPADEEELQKLIAFLHEESLPFYILGNGTNLLVSDEGVDRVVVEIGKNLDQLTLLKEEGDTVTFRALAGTLLGKTASYAAKHHLTGMEALRGIPGTVGGAVTMNAGAYGTEIKDVLVSANVLTEKGELRTLSAEELDLGYRHSIIPEENYIVVSAVFRLKKGDDDAIQVAMQDFQQRRQDKQPLDKPSAGSTFKRPEGYFAGKLIEDTGLRGFRHGGAMVSEKHCGFVVTDGPATAREIYWLIGEIRKRVLLEQGVELTPEVKLWGKF